MPKKQRREEESNVKREKKSWVNAYMGVGGSLGDFSLFTSSVASIVSLWSVVQGVQVFKNGEQDVSLPNGQSTGG